MPRLEKDAIRNLRAVAAEYLVLDERIDENTLFKLFPYEDGWSPLEWEIDCRSRWEHELYVYDHDLEQWLRAPSMKLWHPNGDLLLRTGLRPNAIDFSDRDVTYVGHTVEQIAKYAVRGMPLPCTVHVKDFDHEAWWIVTVRPEPLWTSVLPGPW